MTVQTLDPDALLTTTRSVRLRLDLERPVERHLIEECLAIALQAPTGGNRQKWSFVVVTDQAKRQALGEIYARGWQKYMQAIAGQLGNAPPVAPVTGVQRIYRSAQYLADHMEDVPVLVVPCIAGRLEHASIEQQAGRWGSILPATWSFMLAARARGLGTCWTTLHLHYEQDAAELLGIPYDRVTQAALIPVAHTLGSDFRPAPRQPLDDAVHWESW